MKDFLETVEDALKKVRTVRNNLEKLHDVLEDAEDAVKLLAKVPKIKLVFQRLQGPVSKFEDKARTAESKARDLDKKVDPIRRRVTAVRNKVEDAAETVETIEDKSARVSTRMRAACRCVLNMPDNLRPTPLATLETVSGKLDPALAPIESALEVCDSTLSGMKIKIRDLVNPFKSFLDKLNRAIIKVLDAFDPIKDMLSGFVKGLKKKFWGISVRDILKGVDTLFSWTDWLIKKALNFLGVPKDIPLPSLPSLDLPDLIDLPTVDLSNFLDKFDVSVPFPYLKCVKTGPSCGSSWFGRKYEYGCYITYGGLKIDTDRCYAYRRCSSSIFLPNGIMATKR